MYIKKNLTKLTCMKLWQGLRYSVMSHHTSLSTFFLFLFSPLRLFILLCFIPIPLLSFHIYVHASAFLFKKFRLVFRTRIKCLIVYSIQRYTLTVCIIEWEKISFFWILSLVKNKVFTVLFIFNTLFIFKIF